MALHKMAKYNSDVYCMLGNMRMIKRLVAHGVDMDEKGVFTTPLYGAIEGGWYSAVKYLLDHGAGLTPWDGQDALEIAAKCGNPKIIDLLREYGAYTANLSTLLSNACGSGCLEMVNRFIAEGAEIQDDHFHEASESGNLDVFKTLLKIAPDKYDRKCLPYAIRISHPEMVELLLEQGEDINQDTYWREYTSILDMAIKNTFDICCHRRYMANSKNKVLRRAAKSRTYHLPRLDRYEVLLGGILRFAEDRQKVIDILLKYGATPIEQKNIHDGDFIKLCKGYDDYDYTENIADLLSRGANVHERDEDNTNAMHMAFCKDYPNLVKLLTLFGMNINSINEHSASPEVISNRFKHKRIIHFYLNNGGEVLESYESDYHNFIASIINAEDIGSLEKVLQIYPDINRPWDTDGNTVLHYAAYWGKIKMINHLLQLGADIKVRNTKGMTSLMCATDINTAEHLILHGINPNDADNDGNSALFHAKDLNMLRLLIKHGVDINHRNNSGKTIIDMAENNIDWHRYLVRQLTMVS